MTNAGGAPAPRFLDVGAGAARRRIAYRLRPAAGSPKATIVWLGGFRSDMLSTKAGFLDAQAAAAGRAFLRFDYFGHGESEGRFEDGTIGLWLEDALAALALVADRPATLVGSSMGGWIALLAARALGPEAARRFAGMVLIAPAVDFTERLMTPKLPAQARDAIARDGVFHAPSDYSPEPTPITRRLLEEGRLHNLLDRPVRSFCPVHILQGLRDPDVPAAHARLLMEHMAQDPATLTIIPDGDHRLSRPQDLDLLGRVVAAMG